MPNLPSPVRRAVAALALALAFAALPSNAAADSPDPAGSAAMSEAERDRQAEAIARTIMSPFCPGRTVSSCPNAAPWRADIRRWVGEGVDAEEIKRRLAARVPEHDLFGIPKNRLGWLLPVGLGVGALGLLVFLLRYLVKPNPASGPSEGTATKGAAPPAAGDDASAAANGDKSPEEWEARLEQELETIEN